MEERLNKLLARAGLASRRGADEIIAAGRVTVNGEIVTELGTKVDPRKDDIRVDGERIRPERVPDRYLALYKPRHVITTASDPFDRPTVMDFIDPNIRLFPVGRLDAASEGLILLTNDGDLANQLMHPRHEHEKEYRVKISGTPLEKTLETWRQGMYLEEGRTLPAQVTVESSSGGATWLRFVLKEGKNRQIRRMIEAFNHQVHRLIRIRMGPVLLGNLQPGEWRRLSQEEVEALHAGSNEPVYTAGMTKQEEVKSKKPLYREGWARPKREKKSRPGRSHGARQRKPGGRTGRSSRRSGRS